MIKFFYSDRKQINGHLGPESMGGGGQATGEGLEGTLEVKKNVPYLDWTGGYTAAYMYQNSLNCTLERDAFYFASIKWNFEK